jgi:hypothetical protein
MSIYKYFPMEAGTRFFSTWALRITPPDLFNDPFEMCPPIEIVRESQIFAVETLRSEMATRMAQDLSRNFPSRANVKHLADMVCGSILGTLSPKLERQFLRENPLFKKHLFAIKQQFEMAVIQARNQLPDMMQRIEKKIHQTVRETIGVLCMSLNGNHPLMWAHYAQEHRGLVIEFDENAPCFNRRRTNTDELGAFRPVNYSSARPLITGDTDAEWFEQLALTKALEWKYEEEVRFLLDVSCADRKVGDNIALIEVPVGAVHSVTFGCRASPEFIASVMQQLRKPTSESNISLFSAEVDNRHFALNYVPISD